MSYTVSTDVFCDECGDWTHGVTGYRHGRRMAWKNAKSKGWTKGKPGHLCPICNGKAKMKLESGAYVWNKSTAPRATRSE